MLSTLEKELVAYAESFYTDDEQLNRNLRLKLAHTFRVRNETTALAAAEAFPPEQARLAVRAALLHDFFMYNWNDPASMRPLHGFTHAREALCNAQKQFELNEIERDVIKKHMFPLNIALPRYRETALVSAADKISAVMELVHSARALRILRRCRAVGL